MIFVSEVAFVSQCADFVRFIVPASLSFVFVIDLIHAGGNSIDLVVAKVVVIGVHLIVERH